MADYNGDSKPVPDPTVLTTEQLIREINALNGTLQLQLTAMRGLVDEKLVSVAMQFAAVDTHFGLIESQRVEQNSTPRPPWRPPCPLPRRR